MRKDVLKTADNYRKLVGGSCFLNIKALDKIISEPESGAGAVEGFAEARTGVSPGDILCIIIGI